MWQKVDFVQPAMTSSMVGPRRHSKFSSVAQPCPTLCNPIDCNMPGLPVHHQLLECTQTHIHWVGDAIQPSHLLSCPSLPTFNLSQHHTWIKKRSWSLFDGLLPVLFESWWNHYIWEVCSTNQWDALKTAKPPASIGQQKGPNSSHQYLTSYHTTNASNVEWIGLQSFTSSTTFTWSLTNRLPVLQASQQPFAGKVLQQPARCRKCFPRIHWILKHGFLCYRNKSIYFSLAKCDYNGSYFD